MQSSILMKKRKSRHILGTTGKSENERLSILKNEDTRQRWLDESRKNKPVDNANGGKAASRYDGQQQRRNMISRIGKNLITRAQIDVHDAIEYGNIDPEIVAKDVVSNAIVKGGG